MQKFKEFLIKQQLRPKTIHEYGSAIERFLYWYNETNHSKIEVENLQIQDLQEYRSFLLHVKKLHARTINKNLAAIRKWLQFHRRLGKWIDEIDLPDVPIARKQEPRWLPKNDVAAILYAIEQEKNDFLRARDRCMVYLELFRGIRINEILSLQIDDIILTPGRQKVIIRDGKGGIYADVDLSVCRKILYAIQTWIEVRANSKFASSSYLFVTERSPKATYGAVDKMVSRISKRSGVSFTTHMLRHTHGHDVQKLTKDLNQTKEALRHKDIRSTLIYTQPSKEEIQQVYKSLEEQYKKQPFQGLFKNMKPR